MRRLLIVVVVMAGVGLLVWAFVGHLETGPQGRDELAAITLRAPEGFQVRDLGASSFSAAAVVLDGAAGSRVGVRFSDGGDDVILLVDRGGDRVIEMRAAGTGTIVERTWQGSVDRRLEWAAEHGNLDLPGLPPPTGKNLYH